MTSRGPAARKSGTSKPRVRRRMLGMPSSSSMPWISSASAWLRPPATRTSSPPVYWRLDLAGALVRVGRAARARRGRRRRAACRSRRRSARRASTGARTGGRRAARRPPAQLPGLGRHRARPPRPARRGSRRRGRSGALGVGDRADQVERVGPALGEVDVGLRGIGVALGVRVVDRRRAPRRARRSRSMIRNWSLGSTT